MSEMVFSEKTEKRPLIIIAGPTAAGKTDSAVKLAKKIGGEIISADSMQVYRMLDIGSAKIRPEEMQGVPHHLIDVLDPKEDFNVYVFYRMVKEALEEIYAAGHIPIIAGGTGFYIQAVLYDVDFTENDTDLTYRHELEELAKNEGYEAVAEILKEVDPESYERIDHHNVKRMIRAAEFFHLTGQKISQHNDEQKEKESPYDFRYYVLTRDREELYDRIDRRVDLMMEEGLLEEVKRLREYGCSREMTSMQGLGYKQLYAYLDGECSLEEAVEQIKMQTRHFAKRQLTWFRRERDVKWVNLSEEDFIDVFTAGNQ